MKVETRGRGVLLPELKLALDTSAPGFESLCSHAHGDHIPWDASHSYASPETCDLLAVRAPFLRSTAIPWGEPTRIGRARVTLHPAGHILGSALTLVEAPDGERLLYTADTKVHDALTTRPAEFPEADVLIVESTFGLPIFRWPDVSALRESIVRWTRGVLDEGATPVLLGYALGKSQEICAILAREGIPVVAHGAVWNMCRVYERHGVGFGATRPYVPGEVGKAALVVPGSFREHPMVLKLDHRIGYCSGWARLSRSRTQHDADALFPLSDHADLEGLLDIVARVRPRRVYANHGYSDILAHLLRKQGLDASPLLVGHTEEDDVAQDAQQRLGEA